MTETSKNKYTGCKPAKADGPSPEKGYDIKGNEDSMLYHVLGSQWYDITVAEVYFKTEEDAKKAGFTQAGSDKK